MSQLTDGSDQEPEIGAKAAAVPTAKSRMALTRVRRDLTDEELGSPAVQKMLIDEIERLERETSELVDFRDRFYDADKRAAILAEQAKKSKAAEIVFGVTLSVGSAALGYVPVVWDSGSNGPMLIAFGLILIIGGIVSRSVKP